MVTWSDSGSLNSGEAYDLRLLGNLLDLAQQGVNRWLMNGTD